MRRTRSTLLATALAALPLAAVSCGTATSSTPATQPDQHAGSTSSHQRPPTGRPASRARPAAENVPLPLSSAVIGWSLAPGGTPVRRELSGPRARKLVRDFNALRIDTAGVRHCPMIATRRSDVVINFTADGHTWTVDVPACPNIRVTRDGSRLPALDFGQPFMEDLKLYGAILPQSGRPRAGEAIPLVQPPTTH
jgi:hypothetical protein